MFKKLVRNLPFNPSLISNLRDYDLRLKKELKTRSAGLVVLLIVLILQVGVVLFPPTSSTTNSPNDLISINSGTLDQLFSECNNNIDNYQNILSHYELSCSDLYAGKTVNIGSAYANNSLFSLNRLPYGASSETPTVINGQELYIRKLSFGNKLKTANIKVREINLGSQIIYISLSSGNLISTENYLIDNQTPTKCSVQQPNPCFKYSISARDITSGNSDVNNSTVSSGDTLAYTLSATNISGKRINNYVLKVNMNNALAYSNLENSYGGSLADGIVSYPVKSIDPNQAQTEEITTRIKSPLPNNSVSSSDPNYFDQKMITSFGNTIIISVPKNFQKFYEININNGFPSSSYAVSLLVLALMIILMVYFILRGHLIRQEIKVIRHTHSSHRGDSRL